MVMGIADMDRDFQELQKFADTQYSTIEQLQEEIINLKEQNASLLIMLEQNLPNADALAKGILSHISNEQLICETQIHNLKTYSVTRDLTLEETRKFQIFSEVLKNIKKNAPDESLITVRKMSSEDLLKLVENSGPSSTPTEEEVTDDE